MTGALENLGGAPRLHQAPVLHDRHLLGDGAGHVQVVARPCASVPLAFIATVSAT
jgi:hypothetical protein